MDSGYINAWVYAVRKDIRKYLDHLPGKFSFERNFLQEILPSIEVAAFFGDGYFIDIGVPEDYLTAQQELASALKEAPR